MSLLTTWGYTLTEADGLPAMLTVQEYATYTGRNDSPDRVEAEIDSACAAIRNFVGWHLGPCEPCQMSVNALDRRVVFVGRDILLQLPARFVTEVSSVTIDGIEHTDVSVDTNGLVRVFDACVASRRSRIEVEYMAGLEGAIMDPIKELIANRVTHAIAVPAGITSEAAGGVSVTYNAGWINNSRATALAGDNKELLIPYKVQGVF